jgi:hypothetical protein
MGGNLTLNIDTVNICGYGELAKYRHRSYREPSMSAKIPRSRENDYIGEIMPSASCNRSMRGIHESGGVTTTVVSEAMHRTRLSFSRTLGMAAISPSGCELTSK